MLGSRLIGDSLVLDLRMIVDLSEDHYDGVLAISGFSPRGGGVLSTWL